MDEKVIVARPVWSDAIRGRRAEVWFRRHCSAWDLAQRLHAEVTEEAMIAAKKLLDSIQRYALADVREWEMANESEWYCNSERHQRREAALDKRRERLQLALKPYRITLVNYGAYPTLIDDETQRELYFLHYFE